MTAPSSSTAIWPEEEARSSVVEASAEAPSELSETESA